MTRFNAAKKTGSSVSSVGEMKLILTTHFFCACMPTYFNLRNATKGHSDSEVRQI